jgi:hypothetical protein
MPQRRSFQDRPGTVADLRRDSYSVRYSLWRDLATPFDSVWQALGESDAERGLLVYSCCRDSSPVANRGGPCQIHEDVRGITRREESARRRFATFS